MQLETIATAARPPRADDGRPVLVVIGGLPGSGRTTLLRRLFPDQCPGRMGLDSEHVADRLRARGAGCRTASSARACTAGTGGAYCGSSAAACRSSSSPIPGPARAGGLRCSGPPVGPVGRCAWCSWTHHRSSRERPGRPRPGSPAAFDAMPHGAVGQALRLDRPRNARAGGRPTCRRAADAHRPRGWTSTGWARPPRPLRVQAASRPGSSVRAVIAWVGAVKYSG